ncbi:MAG: hypothetical protein AAFY99_12600 [Pseudomonadota bacterium]
MQRMMKALTASLILLATTAIGVAGPEGNYDVRGTGVDGEPYAGSVTVTRTGETYSVKWNIGGDTYFGSGIGASPLHNGAIMGHASESDNVLTIGYSGSYEELRVAFYMEHANGVWQGIWTEYGSPKVSVENWYPKRDDGQKRILEY